MRIGIAIGCCVCAFSLAAAAQDVPKVPRYIRLDKLKIRLTEHAQREIQDKVEKLWEGKKSLHTKAERARVYFPLIADVFKEEGVPTDFKYLAIQESALLGHAVSTSQAVGYWQFKQPAAREVGLRMDAWVDERKHIMAATRGAARYLKRQQLVFDNWIYALTAYYTGRGGAHPYVNEKYFGQTAMVISKRNHWYVKWFLAHRIVFAEKLKTRSSNPMHLKVYAVKKERTLADVAARFGVKESALKVHNRWLKRSRLPQNSPPVLVPLEGRGKRIDIEPVRVKIAQSAQKAHKQFKAMSDKLADWVANKKVQARPHSVRINGRRSIVGQTKESWADLVKRSGKSEAQLLRYNELREAPVEVAAGVPYFVVRKKRRAHAYYHTLQRNETLWEVAQYYGIRLASLRHMNHLATDEAPEAGLRLHLRQKRDVHMRPQYDRLPPIRPLKTPHFTSTLSEDERIAEAFQKAFKGFIPDDHEEDLPAKLPPLPAFHIIAPGETLFAVSRKYKVNIHRLLEHNQLTMQSHAYPGQKIYLPRRSALAPKGHYVVQPGDTLYGIARKHQTTIQALMQLNKKTTTQLHIGETLRLK